MKKSKAIKLVLVAGIVASCSSHNDYETSSRLHIRGDSTSSYTRTNTYMGHGYYHFIPFGFYAYGQGYRHGGYESSGFSHKATSSSSSRGGFGRSGFRVGS